MDEIHLSQLLPAPPDVVFNAWLDSKSHRNFTGGNAVIDPRQGGHISAWDGYITGIILKLEPYHRIVQSWRTTDFHPLDPSSTLEVIFEPEGDGTLLTLNHVDLPKDQAEKYRLGWEESYLIPMLGYFTMLSEKTESISSSPKEIDETNLPEE